ncbi:MAG TPA: amidohydrolase family protein [bacterium]|nr:amidohydrolase family protein [bacterium]
MLIDIHTHVINMWEEKPEKHFTARKLLNIMDRLGIDKFVLLPIGASPETRYFYFGTEEVLDIHKKYPDRVIPFCNVDPRAGSNSEKTDFSWILNHYKEQGCKGLGELTANMYFDDPKCLNLYRHCGKVGFPVTFHLYSRFSGSYGLVDDFHLPHLENALRECPETVFLGHATAFWSEISSGVTEDTRIGYPKGPIPGPGRICELMKKYPNLRGDLSAGSGYNAITRDMEFGYRFLEEFQDQLLFGTDICHYGQDAEIVPYIHDALKNKHISKTAYKKITHENAIKLLNL